LSDGAPGWKDISATMLKWHATVHLTARPARFSLLEKRSQPFLLICADEAGCRRLVFENHRRVDVNVANYVQSIV
jgi:hypothetical protein